MIPSNPRDRETRKSVGETTIEDEEMDPRYTENGNLFFSTRGGTKIGG